MSTQAQINTTQKETNEKQIEINDSTKFSFNAKEIIGFVVLLAGIMGSWFNLSTRIDIQKQIQAGNDKLILQKLTSIDEKLTSHLVEGNRLEDQMRQKVIANDIVNNEQNQKIAAISALLKINQ